MSAPNQREKDKAVFPAECNAIILRELNILPFSLLTVINIKSIRYGNGTEFVENSEGKLQELLNNIIKKH